MSDIKTNQQKSEQNRRGVSSLKRLLGATQKYHYDLCFFLPDWIYDEYKNNIAVQEQIDIMIEKGRSNNLHPRYTAIKIKSEIEDLMLITTAYT